MDADVQQTYLTIARVAERNARAALQSATLADAQAYYSRLKRSDAYAFDYPAEQLPRLRWRVAYHDAREQCGSTSLTFALFQDWQETLFKLCELEGHQWVDDSYAGPESGYMGIRCKRCGHTEGSQLY